LTRIRGLDMSERSLEELTKRIEELTGVLHVTNRLLAANVVSSDQTIQGKSLRLLNAGLRPKDVAAILGVPIGSVTKARSRAQGKTKH